MLMWLANRVRERNQTLYRDGVPPRFDAAFSLVELLVVVAIVAILAAIGIPVYLNQQSKAEKATASSDGAAWATEVGNLSAKYSSFSCDPKTASGVTDPNCTTAQQLTGGKISVDTTAKTLTLTLPTSNTYSPSSLPATQTVPVTVSPNTTMVTMVAGDTTTGYVGYGMSKLWCFVVDNNGQKSVFTNDGQVEGATSCPAPNAPVAPPAPYGVPLAPTIASVTAANSTVTAMWTPAASDPNPATSWTLVYKLSTATEWKTTGPYPAGTTTALIPGIKPGTYSFKVAGTNSTGQGPFSSPYTLIIDPYKPIVDVQPSIICDATFQWNPETTDYPAPAGYTYNGGTPLYSVELQYKLPSSGTWTTVADTSVNSNRTKTISGLAPNTTYDYRVRATNTNLAGNGAGTVGDWSATKQFSTIVPGGTLPAPTAFDSAWVTNQYSIWDNAGISATNKRDMVFTLTSPNYSATPGLCSNVGIDHFEAVAYADGKPTGIVTVLSPVAGATQTTVSFLDKIDPNTGVPGLGDRNITFTVEAVTAAGEHSPASPQSPPVLTVPNPPTNVGFHGANLDPASAAATDTNTRNRVDQTETVFWTSPYYTPTTQFRVNLNSYIPDNSGVDTNYQDYVNGRIVSANPGIQTSGTGPTKYMDLPTCAGLDTFNQPNAKFGTTWANWVSWVDTNNCGTATGTSTSPSQIMCVAAGNVTGAGVSVSNNIMNACNNQSASNISTGVPVTTTGVSDPVGGTPTATFTIPNYRPPTTKATNGGSDSWGDWVKGYVRSGNLTLGYTTPGNANCTTTETINGPAVPDTTYYQRVAANDNGSSSNSSVKQVPCQTFTGFGTTNYYASVTALNNTGSSWASDQARISNPPDNNANRAKVRTTPQTPYAPMVGDGWGTSSSDNLPDYQINGYEVADTTQRAQLNDSSNPNPSYLLYDVTNGSALVNKSNLIQNAMWPNVLAAPDMYTDATGAAPQKTVRSGFASCPWYIGSTASYVTTTCNRWGLGSYSIQHNLNPGIPSAYRLWYHETTVDGKHAPQKSIPCVPPYTTNGTLDTMWWGFPSTNNKMGIPYNGSDGLGGSSSCSPIPRAAAMKYYGTRWGGFSGYTATEKTIQSPTYSMYYAQSNYGEYASQYKAKACNTTFTGVQQCSNYSDTTPYRRPAQIPPGPPDTSWATKTDFINLYTFDQSFYFVVSGGGAKAFPLYDQTMANNLGLSGTYCSDSALNCTYSSASPVGRYAPWANSMITSWWQIVVSDPVYWQNTCYLWSRGIDGVAWNASRATANSTGCYSPTVASFTNAGGQQMVWINLPRAHRDAISPSNQDAPALTWSSVYVSAAYPTTAYCPSLTDTTTVTSCNTNSHPQRMLGTWLPPNNLTNVGTWVGNLNARSCGGAYGRGTPYLVPQSEIGFVDNCTYNY